MGILRRKQELKSLETYSFYFYSMNKYKLYYKYWLKTQIADGEAVMVRKEAPSQQKAKEFLNKKHNFPVGSRAEEHNIFFIRIFKLLNK